MKKLLILMMILLLALGAVACGKKPAAVPPTTAETTAVQTTQETSTEAEPDIEVKEISGTVIDAAMHSLILKADTTGEELMFATEGADIRMEEGLTIDSFVAIQYTGEIKGTDTSGVQVLEIRDKADNQSLDAEEGDVLDFNILQGTIVKGSEGSESVTIQTADGVNLTFRGADVGGIVTTSEVSVGKEVALAYQGIYNGRDLKGLKLLLLLDDQPTWEVRAAQGVTVYNMMSSFEIQLEDGTHLAFAKDGCGQETEALTKDSGDHVVVTYVSTQKGENYPLYIEAAAN